jgi:hypothetical protein
MRQLEIQNILYHKEHLMILNDIKFFVYLINMIFILHQRNEIIKHRKYSLFTTIDHNLNEALFKNLINRSINPYDNNLSEEFSKILDDSRNKQNHLFDRTEDNIKNYIDNTNEEQNHAFDNTDDNINYCENKISEK